MNSLKSGLSSLKEEVASGKKPCRSHELRWIDVTYSKSSTIIDYDFRGEVSTLQSVEYRSSEKQMYVGEARIVSVVPGPVCKYGTNGGKMGTDPSSIYCIEHARIGDINSGGSSLYITMGKKAVELGLYPDSFRIYYLLVS